GYEPKAKNKIMQLNEIGRDAVKEFREDVTSKIIQFLSEIGKKSARAGKIFENAMSLVVRGLRELGIGSIETGFDDMIPGTAKTAVMGLKDIGVEAAKMDQKGLLEVAGEAIGGLKYWN
ncbi:MAG: hypothetical protein IMF19_10605, partial [Proteobacteria bacterium]|nr:hypothetical protein [Pseudomonadota bacterium]